MNQGALYNVTQTIDTYVYRALLQRNDIAMSSAASFDTVDRRIYLYCYRKSDHQEINDEKSSLF